MTNCPTCMSINNAGATICYECGYKLHDNPLSSTPVLGGKLPPNPPLPLVSKIILSGLALAVPASIVIVVSHNGRAAKQQARAAHWEAVAQKEIEANRIDEIGIVTECDIAVKRSLTAQNSYDPADWKFTVKGSTAEVMRKFDATNAFGGTITSGYTCIYDNASKRIRSLEVISPNGYSKLI